MIQFKSQYSFYNGKKGEIMQLACYSGLKPELFLTKQELLAGMEASIKVYPLRYMRPPCDYAINIPLRGPKNFIYKIWCC